MFKRGDIVWGKFRSYAWWPAIVLNPEDCGRDNVEKNQYWIFFFGDHKVWQVKCSEILDFKVHFAKKSAIKSGKLMWKHAIQEVLTILAAQYNFKYSDPSVLFEWAKKLFNVDVQCSSRKSNPPDLPDIVKEALLKDCFKRKYETSSEEDSENEIDNILKEVSKGRKSLEDICIMCCNSDKAVIMKHALFIGGVCQNCKKIMNKIIKYSKGKMNDICVLCGQGGKLIYCSNSTCLSAYCEICMDYMAAKECYSKILNDNNWKCYLCDLSHNACCLIKRREVHLSMPIELPPVPDTKVPICVIGHTDAALTVLKKKKIAVGKYCIKPSRLIEPTHYFDFSEKELYEISADFIYGSFFAPASVADDNKNALILFAKSFYRLLFRLNCTRIYNQQAFFLFLSDDAILDADIKSRVMRFLRVDPIKVTLNRMSICLWTNLPPIKGIHDHQYLMKQNKGAAVEEIILDEFLEPLKLYFKQE